MLKRVLMIAEDLPIGHDCRKCNVKARVVLQTKFPYCRECFLEYFKHKFRSTLGKSKIMKHGDKILVCFSGSASSVCLIDLIRDSMNDANKKKMSFTINVLYIDECAAFITNNQPNVTEIKDILAPYNFKVFYSDLGTFFAKDLDFETHSHYKNVNNIDLIGELFSKFRSLTSKIDLLVKIRKNILYKFAEKLGCQKIFSAETSDHLAANTISNIVLGKGGQLSQDIGFSDNSLNELILVRPLQDCSKKEVSYYNIFNGLKSLSTTTFGSLADKYSSIQKLTESFINELQSSFPSTVLTVRGTGSKLSSANSDQNLECCLCQGKMDERKYSLTAQQASHISKMVSNTGPDEFNSTVLSPVQNSITSCKSCSCLQRFSEEEEPFDELLNLSLCYGCRLVLKDCESVQALPKAFLANLREKTQLNNVHNEIKAFLLYYFIYILNK
ncbi:cytosolic thiouridylase subunit 2 isoform X2 [Rhodnius prolixus]|uniref:cytosolic thiouridylase subunit 2 isoform X2 n=1 Tax=Rhodnius prolixus TaxID=13249 RepID=UPI003D18FA32